MDNQDQPNTGLPVAFTDEERIQYRDGTVCFGYRTPGTLIVLGANSPQQFARDFSELGGHAAIITTASGRLYGLAHDLLLDRGNGEAFDWPGQERLVIGNPCPFPDADPDDPIVQVVLLYRTNAPINAVTNEVVESASPFKAMIELIDQIKANRQGTYEDPVMQRPTRNPDDDPEITDLPIG